MAKGKKTGGRKPGALNRATREILETLEEMDHDPIKGMVLIAKNPKASLELQGRMNAELAQYIHPKRKAIEVTPGPPGGGSTLAELLMARDSILQFSGIK